MELRKKKDKKPIITERNKKIIEKVANGYSTEQISKELNLSLSLINSDLVKLFHDTKTYNRAHLVAWAYENNIL